MRLRTCTLAVTTLLVAAAAHAPLTAQDDFEWSGTVPAGAWLRVHSANGPIDVLPATGDRIEVVGTRDGRGRSGQPVRFEMVRAGDDVVICALTDDAECTDDGIRNRWDSNNPERVNFTIRLPAGTNVRIGTGNGDLRLEGVGGDIGAGTGNGDVEIRGTSGTVRASSGNGEILVDRATGPVRASTGNGRVDVRTARGPVQASTGNGRILIDMASLEGSGDLEFHTGSGDVVLRLPDDLDAELQVRLGNGRVDSDFPLMVQGRTNFRNLRATIGRGGRRLIVSSGNGDVALRRR